MTVDIEKLEELAKACGDLNWRAIQENWTEWAIRDDHAYIAIMRTKSAKQAGPCSDREAKAKFLCAVTPAAVLELIADNKSGSSRLHEVAVACANAEQEREELRAEIAGLKTGYEAYERVNAELSAECEALRKIISESATACGAAISVDCSLEFMAMLPAEIGSVVGRLRKGAERREWEGFNNGLIRAGNLRPSIVHGDDGARVLNDIRRQIDSAMVKEQSYE